MYVLKSGHQFTCRFCYITLSCLQLFCADPVKTDPEFTLIVVDVGEGLSQIGVQNSKAIVWDVGSDDNFDELLRCYKEAGSPVIQSIVVSHSDWDHCGGLTMLDSNVSWTGNIIVSEYEDTAYLRSLSSYWEDQVNFSICKKGNYLNSFEDIEFKGIEIECLWPPENASKEFTSKNTLSLTFLIRYGQTTCMIASDIDSNAQKTIAEEQRYKLRSWILIAPHHGSADFNPLFFLYVNPDITVISCSEFNQYGHPSESLMTFLINDQSDILLTYLNGSTSFISNSYYWYRNY